jgi:hypothetical protein
VGEGESINKKKKYDVAENGKAYTRRPFHLDKVVAQIIRSVKHFRKDEDRKKQ